MRYDVKELTGVITEGIVETTAEVIGDVKCKVLIAPNCKVLNGTISAEIVQLNSIKVLTDNIYADTLLQLQMPECEVIEEQALGFTSVKHLYLPKLRVVKNSGFVCSLLKYLYAPKIEFLGENALMGTEYYHYDIPFNRLGLTVTPEMERIAEVRKFKQKLLKSPNEWKEYRNYLKSRFIDEDEANLLGLDNSVQGDDGYIYELRNNKLCVTGIWRNAYCMSEVIVGDLVDMKLISNHLILPYCTDLMQSKIIASSIDAQVLKSVHTNNLKNSSLINLNLPSCEVIEKDALPSILGLKVPDSCMVDEMYKDLVV